MRNLYFHFKVRNIKIIYIYFNKIIKYIHNRHLLILKLFMVNLYMIRLTPI